MIYNIYIKKITEISLASQNLLLLYNMSTQGIENIFSRPRKCTLDSKLREFQFKLLYRIIYTNQYLYKFKFLSEDVCSYCKNAEETYEHIFFECNEIKKGVGKLL